MARGAIRNFAKKNKISIREAIQRLKAGNQKARAGKGKQDVIAIAQQQKANQDSMLVVIRGIDSKLDNLATV